MIVRKLRLQRGWSQDQLAEFSGLSMRTIQRLERGQSPSLESARSLAAVFEVDHMTFMQEDELMTHSSTSTTEETSARTVRLLQEEREAMRYARRVKAFYEGAIVYVIMAAIFLGFSDKAEEPIVIWVFFGVGVGLIAQGLLAFEVIRFDFPSWEKKLVEKRLGRKL